MLGERANQLGTGVDEDFTVDPVLEVRDLFGDVAVEHGRVGPPGLLQGGGHDVLGHAVELLRPFTRPIKPPCGEPLVALAAQQKGLGA